MDVVEGSTNTAKSFVSYLTRFDNETKNELLNVAQYSMLSVLPIALLNKGSQKIFPEVDEEKGTFEIALEALGQIVYLFAGIYFIHRLITFVQPYSGEKYQEFNLISIVIPFLVIVLSLQSKLGEKINILVERALAMVDEYAGTELSSATEAPKEVEKPKGKSNDKGEEKKQAENKEGLVQMQPGEYNQMHQQMTHNPFAPPQQPQMANEMYDQDNQMGGMSMMETAGSGMMGGESGSLAYASF